MTEIEKKALALLNEATDSTSDDIEDFSRSGVLKALLHAIEQHEAFRQEVSDVLEDVRDNTTYDVHPKLWRYIRTKPADPLVGALNDMAEDDDWFDTHHAAALRAALAKRGLQVTEIEQ